MARWAPSGDKKSKCRFADRFWTPISEPFGHTFRYRGVFGSNLCGFSRSSCRGWFFHRFPTTSRTPNTKKTIVFIVPNAHRTCPQKMTSRVTFGGRFDRQMLSVRPKWGQWLTKTRLGNGIKNKHAKKSCETVRDELGELSRGSAGP